MKEDSLPVGRINFRQANNIDNQNLVKQLQLKDRLKQLEKENDLLRQGTEMKREPSDLISATMLIEELKSWKVSYGIKIADYHEALIIAIEKSRKMVKNYETTREFMEDQKKGLEDGKV